MSSNSHNRASWKVPASIISKRTSNPIRAIVDHIKVKPNPNKSMISLALGDPTLFGNFKIHQTCTDAVAKQLHSYKANGYPPSTGYQQSRQAVADKFTTPEAPLSAQDVIITSGCSGALDMCIGVLCNEGDNILLPRPGFSLYQTLADSKGVEVRYYDLLVSARSIFIETDFGEDVTKQDRSINEKKNLLSKLAREQLGDGLEAARVFDR